MVIGEGSLTRTSPQTVLALEGEFDAARASDAHKRMLRLDLRPGGRLVLDLSGLTFMDSTGIRMILRASDCALQARKPAVAASTARSTSAALANATRRVTAPVAGSVTSP